MKYYLLRAPGISGQPMTVFRTAIAPVGIPRSDKALVRDRSGFAHRLMRSAELLDKPR